MISPVVSGPSTVGVSGGALTTAGTGRVVDDGTGGPAVTLAAGVRPAAGVGVADAVAGAPASSGDVLDAVGVGETDLVSGVDHETTVPFAPGVAVVADARGQFRAGSAVGTVVAVSTVGVFAPGAA